MQKLLRVIYEFEDVEELETVGPPWIENEITDEEVDFLCWHHWMAIDPTRAAEMQACIVHAVSDLYRKYSAEHNAN